jgi:dihydroorotase
MKSPTAELGDIITHCYNGKPNRILTPPASCAASITRLARGVRLDVGHGTASFSFEVAKRAIAMGILPHTISSDIYCRNRIDGPVGSLALVMSKFLAIGMTLPQVIDCVTVTPPMACACAQRAAGSGLRRRPDAVRPAHQPVLVGCRKREPAG